MLGEVEQPGAYNISPSTTLFNSLFYFNGPKITGSLRDIRLIRNNKNIASIDFYEYLLSGKQVNDIRLQRNDIVFIPNRGKTIKTIGEINRAKIFELKEDEGLKDLIKIAGDIKPTTYMKRVSIDRIEPPEIRFSTDRSKTTVDVNLYELFDSKKKFKLNDGDAITFLPIKDEYYGIVNIEGSVNRPGTFDLGNGMTLRQLIIKADSLLGDTYTDRAQIIRLNDDLSESIITVNLEKTILGYASDNISLQSNDKISIYSKSEMLFRTNVSISGHVKSPGDKVYYRGMTLYDLVMLGGGFEDESHLINTYFERGELSIYDVDGVLRDIIPFRLDSLLAGKGMADEELKMGSRVRIYSYEEIFGIPPKTVLISGHVKRPGVYELSDNLTVLDLLFLGGGFEDEDHLFKTYLKRFDLIRLNPDKISKDIISINLDKLLKNEQPDMNFNLVAGDEIIVFNTENFISKETVSIEGIVNSPGTYDLKNSMTLFDLIIEAGGVSNNYKNFRVDVARSDYTIDKYGVETYLNSIEFVIENDSRIFDKIKNEKNILLKKDDLIIIRKNPESYNLGFVEIEGAVMYEGQFPIIHNDEKVSDIIDRAGGISSNAYPLSSQFIRGEDTVRLSFEKLINNPRSKFNFVIRDGDKIKINKKPNLVRVIGAVNNPGNYQFIPNSDMYDYIRLAGGMTNEASKYGSYVSYPDGTAKALGFLNFSPKVKDGSVVNILTKDVVEPFNFTEYVTNLTQIYADLSQSYLMIVLALNR